MVKAALLATMLLVTFATGSGVALQSSARGSNSRRLNPPRRQLLQTSDSLMFPPLAPSAALPIAASPAAETLASEFRLSEGQGAVLESLYGNPADSAATIEADLERSGIDVVPPQPFPAPLSEDTLFDYVLLAQARQGSVPAVEELLAEQGDPNVVDPVTGQTPTFAALEQAAMGEPELLMLLLSSGADTNVRDANGTTPLLLAIESGDNATVAALLRYGADANLVGPDGELPLVLAVQQYLEDPSEANMLLVESLLEAGAAPNLADGGGDSGMMLAQGASAEALLDLLAGYTFVAAPASEVVDLLAGDVVLKAPASEVQDLLAGPTFVAAPASENLLAGDVFVAAPTSEVQDLLAGDVFVAAPASEVRDLLAGDLLVAAPASEVQAADGVPEVALLP